MPNVIVHRNFAINQKQTGDFQNAMSDIIENVLHKPKMYIMVIMEDPKAIRFGGSDDPAMYIEVKSVGLPGETPSLLSKEICQAAEKHFSLPQDRVYIEFTDSPGRMWGWNGGTF